MGLFGMPALAGNMIGKLSVVCENSWYLSMWRSCYAKKVAAGDCFEMAFGAITKCSDGQPSLLETTSLHILGAEI